MRGGANDDATGSYAQLVTVRLSIKHMVLPQRSRAEEQEIWKCGFGSLFLQLSNFKTLDASSGGAVKLRRSCFSLNALPPQ